MCIRDRIGFYNTQPLVQRLCVVGSTKIGFYNTQLLESSTFFIENLIRIGSFFAL